MNSSRNQKSQYARTPVCRSLDGWKKAPLMAVTMPYRKFQVTQVSSHSTTITTTFYTEPHTYKYLQKRHINLWDPRYTHNINTPGLNRFWDQRQVNTTLYIAFWSVEPTDFKNVIVENIPPDLSLQWQSCLLKFSTITFLKSVGSTDQNAM